MRIEAGGCISVHTAGAAPSDAGQRVDVTISLINAQVADSKGRYPVSGLREHL